jgi:hypothetical protein
MAGTVLNPGHSFQSPETKYNQQDCRGLDAISLKPNKPVQVIQIGGSEYSEHIVKYPGEAPQAPELFQQGEDLCKKSESPFKGDAHGEEQYDD